MRDILILLRCSYTEPGNGERENYKSSAITYIYLSVMSSFLSATPLEIFMRQQFFRPESTLFFFVEKKKMFEEDC